MTAYVYRCYDSDGVLLYVGCAFNPHRRIKEHQRSTKTLASHALHTLMDRYEVEGPFPAREEADAAEKAAIVAEKPLLNRQHMGTNFGLDYTLSLYLASRNIPIAQVGLHRCTACDSLRRHSAPPGMCCDCRDAEAAGELDEHVAFIAELNARYRIERAA